jgi:hypothetical protein
MFGFNFKPTNSVGKAKSINKYNKIGIKITKEDNNGNFIN